MSTKFPGLMDLDNTKRAAFVACPRKYYWAYVRNLRRQHGSTAIRYGVAWHAMMEKMYSLMIEAGKWVDPLSELPAIVNAGKEAWARESEGFIFNDDYRSLANLQRAFVVYMDTFSNDPGMIKVIATESVFELLMEPETDKEQKDFAKLEPFLFTGKLDMRIELNDAPWITEHKTTGAFLSQAASRLQRSAQQMGYYWASKRLGIDVQGLLISIHHISARKSTKTNDWGDPKIEFQRVPQLYSDFDLSDWRNSFLDTGLRIQQEYSRGLWPMCHDSCYQYGSCSYTDLCEQDGRSLEDRNTYGYIEKVWDVRNECGASE